MSEMSAGRRNWFRAAVTLGAAAAAGFIVAVVVVGDVVACAPLASLIITDR